MSAAPRFVVTELEGYWTPQPSRESRASPGLSVQILDRANCHRIAWRDRTENHGKTTERAKDWLRHEAAKRCAVLNGEPSPGAFNRWRSRFRPVCPKCNRKADPSAAYCKCGTNLYRRALNGSSDATRR